MLQYVHSKSTPTRLSFHIEAIATKIPIWMGRGAGRRFSWSLTASATCIFSCVIVPRRDDIS